MENDFLYTVKRAIKNWWVSLLIGIISIILGIWCFTDPLTTFMALTIMFIAGFMVSGIFEIFFAVSNKDTLHGWGWSLAIGIIDIIFSIVLIANPAIAPEVLSLFIGFWIMFQSFWGIGTSIDLSKYKGSGWGWLLAIAILGLILSIFLIAQPLVTGIFAAFFVAAVLIVYGIFRIILAVKLKSMNKYL